MTVSTGHYWRTCFVMMPYGVRMVNGKRVDFDAIYSKLFKPAIQRVRVKGPVRLTAYRADEAEGSGLVHDTMFRDLLGCRLALADISGANPNVLFEMGIRYAMLPTGTVPVRLKGATIPFDLVTVSIPEYCARPPKEAEAAAARISRLLRETLRRNSLDSPAYKAAQSFLDHMGPPDHPTEFGKAVIEAENSAVAGDVRRAAELYKRAAFLAPDLPLPHDRRSLLLRQAGEIKEAIAAIRRAQILRAPDQSRVLDELFADPLDAQLSQMFEKSKELKLGPEVHKLLKTIPSNVRDQVTVQIKPRKEGYNPDVFVVSPPDVHWAATVPQILMRYGKVSDRGAMAFPEKGYIVSQYSMAFPKRHQRTATASDLARHLRKLDLLGSNVNVKISGGSFGRGGRGGGFTH